MPAEGGKPWNTTRLTAAPDAMAPDGAEVRLLAVTARGSMAQFTLPGRAVSRAMVHRTVEEVWLFLAGHGRMWRASGEREEVVQVGPGVSISIPVGVRFQFRSDSDEALVAVGVTMPPWPGAEEAVAVAGCWPASV
jgi:mannose-6-phosphate isomerase-like protein (cupin superfamily)